MPWVQDLVEEFEEAQTSSLSFCVDRGPAGGLPSHRAAIFIWGRIRCEIGMAPSQISTCQAVIRYIIESQNVGGIPSGSVIHSPGRMTADDHVVLYFAQMACYVN